MFLTIYLTCGIWGVMTNWATPSHLSHAAWLIPLTTFAALFGWIGTAVYLLHSFGVLN